MWRNFVSALRSSRHLDGPDVEGNRNHENVRTNTLKGCDLSFKHQIKKKKNDTCIIVCQTERQQGVETERRRRRASRQDSRPRLKEVLRAPSASSALGQQDASATHQVVCTAALHAQHTHGPVEDAAAVEHEAQPTPEREQERGAVVCVDAHDAQTEDFLAHTRAWHSNEKEFNLFLNLPVRRGKSSQTSEGCGEKNVEEQQRTDDFNDAVLRNGKYERMLKKEAKAT